MDGLTIFIHTCFRLSLANKPIEIHKNLYWLFYSMLRINICKINKNINKIIIGDITMKSMNMESMNNNAELNFDALNTVSGGNFFADLEEVLRRIYEENNKSKQQNDPTSPKTLIGRGKC